MAVSSALIKAYANQFLPVFQFADTERIFPVQVDAWLQQCAQGDWTNKTDAHRGTTAVIARVPLDLGSLAPQVGCNGISGSPIDPSAPGFKWSYPDESFLDFAGWSSLETNDGFVAGDDDYIRAYFAPYFAQYNSALTGTPPPTRTNPPLPTTMGVYCEAAWAGAFTRLDISNKTHDFANPPTNDPSVLSPDSALDPYFVLTYYLFYPATEPPPNTSAMSVTSPDLFFREGQWEAVSFYFKSTSDVVRSAEDLQLPSDPSQVTPDHAVLSDGITTSGDGFSPGLAYNYPVNIGSWTQGGQYIITGGFGGEALESKQVFVTSGTHKNLFSPTPTVTTKTPDPGWSATGGALEGAGGAVAGLGGPIGAIIGFLMILIGFLMQLFGTDSTTTEVPDPSGDIASSNGPSASQGAGGGGTGSVGVDLTILSSLPANLDLPAPAWWPYGGRWGVAISSASMGWNSGGRLVDFVGRSRAYWNTVWLQKAL